MPPSLFRTLTRYAKDPLRDPAEERLTEALVATLQVSPDAAARFLTEDLFGLQPVGQVSVTSQRRTLAGDRVDVELRFGARTNPELLVWLELKHKMRPDAGQLERYQRALVDLRYRSQLALIAPRGVDVPPGTPACVCSSSWQEVGMALARRWRPAAEESQTPGAPLVGEFLAYLREEGLAVTEAFTVGDALALARYDGAHRRIEEVIALAAEQIAIRWAPKPPPSLGREEWTAKGQPWNFWRTYDIVQAGEEGWSAERYWFEWHGRLDSVRRYPRDEPVFGAGVTSTFEHAFGAEHHAWIGKMEKLGFEWSGREHGDHSYLFRYLYPAELVGGVDLEDQAHRLADWVCKTFEKLATRPPGCDRAP